MKKIIVIAITLCVLGASFYLLKPEPTQSKNKPYYSGEAVNFNGKIFIGSTNSGKFELFALENGSIIRKTNVASNDQESKEFYDLLFEKAGGKLFVYLVNGRYLYKYDITNPIVPIVVLKIKDNSWDWFTRLDKVNGKLITIGSKGTKIWNNDFQVIDSYAMINNSVLGSVIFDSQMTFVLNTKLNVYNTVSREKVSEYSIAVNDKQATRGLISNSDDKLVYFVDDKSLKAVDVAGNVKKEFKHTSTVGYDVAFSVVNPDYIYFSDGIGIVKIDKNTFTPVDWTYTTRNTPAGSWAMGLKTVNDGTSEKIVIFNGSNILVVDKNLDNVAFYESIEEDTRPVENLFLNVDKNRGAAGAQVSVVGGGFGLGEELTVEFSKIKQTTITADQNGRFQIVLTVPSVLPGMTDIKATGKTTKKTYSTSFKIE
ncbi:MAG: hypothetical protein WC415_00945 [Patescibacteria group bacterium]|jgi:outer membrane protein assembly factor BamB